MYFVNMSQYEFKHPLVINLTGSYKSSIIFASKEQQLEILKNFLSNGYTGDGYKISRLKRRFCGVMLLSEDRDIIDFFESHGVVVKSLHEVLAIGGTVCDRYYITDK